MKKITDQMRLDWLLGKGVSFFRFEAFKSCYYDHAPIAPRKAIDIAIRAERRRKQ